jgi:hypothetical protein
MLHQGDHHSVKDSDFRLRRHPAEDVQEHHLREAHLADQLVAQIPPAYRNR